MSCVRSATASSTTRYRSPPTPCRCVLQTDRPLTFASKVCLFPHLGLVVAGTGVRNVVEHWTGVLQRSVLTTDVVGLDSLSVACLPRLFDDVIDSLAGGRELPEADRRTTLYHFGHSATDGMVGLKYSSRNGFASEPLPRECIAFTPHISPETLLAGGKRLSTRAKLAKLVVLAKEHEDTLPKAQRLGIGGEIHVTTIAKDAITIVRAHRFEDYQKLYDEMESRLRQAG